MYYALKNDVNGLQKYDFNKCILKFRGRDEIVFEKNKLEKINNRENLKKIFDKSRNSEKISTNIRLIENIGQLFFKKIGYSAFEKFLFEYFNFIAILDNRNFRTSIGNIIEAEKYLYKLLSESGFDYESYEIDRYIERLSRFTYNDLVGLYYYLSTERFLYQLEGRYSIGSRNETFSILKGILKFILLDNIKDNEQDKKVLSFLTDKLIFLPTYRRIEHDSIDLFSEEISLKEGAILSFGVSDVSSLFNKITDKLNNYATKSFNKINSSALNEFISGDHNFDYSIDKWTDKDEEYFAKVLQRVGKEIDENNKLKLKFIFINKHTEDKFLLKLIKRMCEIYDNQSYIESEIIKYINVCNKYLFNKRFTYDKENLIFKIEKIRKDETYKNIKLSSLSSGEKQIISLFAKLYLSHLPNVNLEDESSEIKKQVNIKGAGYWILFDEPELSLSVDWQEMLLPDMMASNRCEFIFATTHSPFIFNNKFKYSTTYIHECVEETDSE